MQLPEDGQDLARRFQPELLAKAAERSIRGIAPNPVAPRQGRDIVSLDQATEEIDLVDAQVPGIGFEIRGGADKSMDPVHSRIEFLPFFHRARDTPHSAAHQFENLDIPFTVISSSSIERKDQGPVSKIAHMMDQLMVCIKKPIGVPMKSVLTHKERHRSEIR